MRWIAATSAWESPRIRMTTPPPQTMKLRVTRNEAIADGINIVEFRDAVGNELPQFSAGAHIAIHVPNGMLRKYSLCNDPAERDRYQVAVKREINGRGGSCSLSDDVKAGDELMVIAPVNDFGLPPRAQEFLFIAGGIGVTPMMAMIWQVIAEGKRFRLFYCSRSPETTAFREELTAPQFKDMVTIYYDQGDPSRSLDLRPILAERKNREHLYCCGPRPLMEAVRAMTDHWSPTAVHFEAFSEAETHKPDDKPFKVRRTLRRGARHFDQYDNPRSPARARARGAQFLRNGHLRHLSDKIAGWRSRSSRSCSGRTRAQGHDHDLRLPRA